MSYQPCIPEDLEPLAGAVAERMVSRLYRQHISAGAKPLFNPLAMCKLVAECIEGILEQRYMITKQTPPPEEKKDDNA